MSQGRTTRIYGLPAGNPHVGNSKVKMNSTVRSFWSEKRQEMAETRAFLNFFLPRMHFRKGDRERTRTQK